MAALAGQIYAQPPTNAPCYGAIGLKAIIALEWLAMGCFYLTICISVVLSLDVDGVPDRLLPLHLHHARILFILPYVATFLGILLLATGYGIDVGERNGSCGWSAFGFAGAPVFAFAVLGVGVYARRLRQRLNAHDADGAPPAAGGGSQVAPGGGGAAERKYAPSDDAFRLTFGRNWFTTWLDCVPPPAVLERARAEELQELAAEKWRRYAERSTGDDDGDGDAAAAAAGGTSERDGRKALEQAGKLL